MAAEDEAAAAATATATAREAVEAPVAPAPAAGMATDGLASSTVARTVAADATTLATLFSTQPGNVYSPVSGGVKRDYDAGTSSHAVLHVHSIRRTSAGGYLIVYTDGQTRHSIEFAPEHCRPDNYCEIRNGGQSRVLGLAIRLQ